MSKEIRADLLLSQELETKCIPTGSRNLDKALGHGLRLGTILEITGTTGKTQLAMQLMVNTVLPAPVGLIDGEVIFISTRKSFLEQRVNQLIDKVVSVYNKSADKVDAKGDSIEHSVTREDLLKRIHHKMIFSLLDLISTVYQLKEMTRKNRKIRLIIIDSFTTHLVSAKQPEETRITAELMSAFNSIASSRKHGCAIVLTNDLTVEMTGDCDLLRPALGDIFHHYIPQRVFIAKSEDGDIIADVQKSLCRGPSLVKLAITADGVRDG